MSFPVKIHNPPVYFIGDINGKFQEKKNVDFQGDSMQMKMENFRKFQVNGKIH